MIAPTDRELAVADVRAGDDRGTVAKRYGVALRTLQRWCALAGVPVVRAPPPPGPARIDRYAGTPATPRARRVWAAIAAGRRDVEIVRLHGVSAGYVSRLRRHWQALGHPISASGEEPPCLET